MEFNTMSAMVSERQSTLRRDGEQVRQGRAARRRRLLPRSRERSPADTR
jgi:hypothetical protein